MIPRNFILASLLLVSSTVHAQQSPGPDRGGYIAVAPQLTHKLASGRLLVHATEHLRGVSANTPASAVRMKAVVYMPALPSAAQLEDLARAGVVCYTGTWTPPMPNHPNGFLLAEFPVTRINDVLTLDCVSKLGSAEGVCRPNNNVAAATIRAAAVWSAGWTGKGVKVGVLDSGIDTTFHGSEFPPCFDKKDYSNYPQLDDDVINRITAHGTHVAATAVGRGTLSQGNIGNEGMPYSGMAPGSCLAFLKIGNDSSAGANDAAIIAAFHDVVTLYHARVINMSYGGWGAYHDGSEAIEQKADWCYTQGAVVVLSAGNSAASNRHVMGTAPANGESDFIQMRANGIGPNEARLSCNLVWFDGPGVRRKLTLKYFDENKNEITAVNHAPVTESPRGTESEYSSIQDYLPEGSSIWYVKVVNASSESQVFHIYEDFFENDWKASGDVTFGAGSPLYTVGLPSTADHALSIAAFTSRSYYTSALDQMRQYRQSIGKIGSFSSWGPRMDGARKPDIAAPGTAVISLRDTNVQRVTDNSCVDNDGTPGGEAMYMVMQGTSMAAPVTAGAAALVLSKYPFLTPQQVYDSLLTHARSDEYTGTTPNTIWGAGKLDVGFLADLPAPAAIVWTNITRSTWPSQKVGDAAITNDGTVYATVGDPWANVATDLYRGPADGTAWTKIKTEKSLLSVAVAKDGALFTARRFGGTVSRSLDRGATWTETGTARDYTALVLCASDSLLVAPTFGQGIWSSSDRGATWTAMHNGLGASASVPIVADGTGGWIYAVAKIDNTMRLRRLHRSTMTWEPAEAGIDTSKHVNALAVSPNGTVFAAVWDRIYVSKDHGASWTQAAILNDYLQALCAASDTVIFVGTVGTGVYRSGDGGLTWRPCNEGFEKLNISLLRAWRGNLAFAAESPGFLYSSRTGYAPTAPALYVPADKAPAVAMPALLRWSTVAGATSYTVEVSLSNDFSRPHARVEGLPSVTWSLGAVTSLTKYWWRVRAVNNAGAGPWSTIREFTTSPPAPAAPLQTEPPNRATGLTPPITLRWVPSPTASTYTVQIARDSAFLDVVHFRPAMTNTSVRIDSLQSQTTYYWSVFAENPGGRSAWSATWSFTTGATQDETPMLASPPNGARAVPLLPRVLLVWLGVRGATAYHVEVTAAGNPTLLDTVTNTALEVYNLKLFTEYSWRVRADFGTHLSMWSAPWSFTTLLEQPVCISPVGPGESDTSITFLWSAVAGAESYRLRVWAAPRSRSDPDIDSAGIRTTSCGPFRLKSGTEYNWQVTAHEAAGSGDDTLVYVFRTRSTTAVPGVPGAVSHIIGQTYPIPAADVLTLRLQTLAPGLMDVSMYDMTGRHVVTYPPRLVGLGWSDIVLSTAGIRPGVYLLRFGSGSALGELLIEIRR